MPADVDSVQIADNVEAQFVELIKQFEALQRENKVLREENARLKKGCFGRSSERLAPGQLSFFAGGTIPEVAPPKSSPSRPSKGRGHGRAPFPEHLERVDEDYDLPDSERTCACGAEMQQIGVDVTERGRYIPGRFEVVRSARVKYACPHGCCVKTAKVPATFVEGGKYDASVYARIAVLKYQDHLSLNRLVGIMQRDGFTISKQTMWGMLAKLDELVIGPVLVQMQKELLDEEILHADETPVQVRLESKMGKSHRGYIYGWRSLREIDEPKVLIEFQPGRSRHGPEGFLGQWSGMLITDGHDGYNPVAEKNGIRRAGCWSHARRYFKDAFDGGSKDAAYMLHLIGRLFALERAMKGRAERRKLGREEFLKLRACKRAHLSAPLFRRIIDAGWDIKDKPSTLPRSSLGKAVKYLLNQRDRLDAFLEEPRAPIHNNDQERSLRHVVTGRKNWLVFGSMRGGEVAGRLYSIMLSCQENGVNPDAYLRDIAMGVATTPFSKVSELTPWAWARRKRQETVQG